MKKFRLILTVLTVLLLSSSQAHAALIAVDDIMILVPDIITEGFPTIEELGIGAIAQPPQAKSTVGRKLQFFYTWQIHHANGSVITLPESDNPNISFDDLQPYALSTLSVKIRISDGVTSTEAAMSPDTWIEIPDDVYVTEGSTATVGRTPPGDSLGLTPPPWWRDISYTIVRITGKRCVERNMFRECIHYNYRSTSPFSVEEENKIKQAMSVVGQRMLSPDVMQCALTNSAPGEWNTTADPAVANFQTFVQNQINNLLNRFPDVYIYEHVAPSSPGVAANAIYGRVQPDLTVTRSGNIDPNRLEFRVVKAQLAGNSVDALAGVFAHELMHQLGHIHPNDNGNGARSGAQRDSFIYAFGDCVEFLVTL